MIASRQNRTLKDMRRLRRSKGDHAFLEGPHLIGEALAAGLALEAVLVPRGGEGLYDAPLARGALVLMLGAEGAGLSRELLARADLKLTIPMASGVESLNAAVAAALVLFEVGRQRAGALSPDNGS